MNNRALRTCLDANVLVSYLLNPTTLGPPGRAVRRCFQPGVELILNEETFIEVAGRISAKLYFKDRIPQDEIDIFFSLIRTIAEVSPLIVEAVPSVSRDRHDDYLIAHSVVERIDVLVSGDKDLLALGSVMNVRIVSPADFVAFLDSRCNQGSNYSRENGW